MNISDEHLIRIEVAVEGNATNASLASRRTEITQLGIAWTIEFQHKMPLFIEVSNHFYRSGWKVLFQQIQFFRLHRSTKGCFREFLGACSSISCKCCNGAAHERGQGLPWSCRKWPEKRVPTTIISIIYTSYCLHSIEKASWPDFVAVFP